MFDNTAANGKVLLVDQTGGGKSHVMSCDVLVLSLLITHGIVLVIVPFLALAADVIQKCKNNDNS
jgi:superfamily II DNA helicase RecQ